MFVAAINILITLLKILVLLFVAMLLWYTIDSSRVETQELNNDTDESANSSLSYSNSTGTESVADALIYRLSLLATVVLGSVAFFCNIITIYVALTTKEVRRKRSSYQIINLALKDAIIGALYTVHLLHMAKYEYDEYIFICLAVVHCVLCFSSCISIVMVALERCFAVVAPFQHKRYVTKKALLIVIVIDWFVNLSLVITFELLFLYYRQYVAQGFSFGYNFALLIAPVATFLLYLVMILFLRRYASTISQSTNLSQRMIMKNINMIITFALIAGIFLACYFPYAVSTIIGLISGYPDNVKMTVISLIPLSPLNSVANMFIYWWRIPEFQMAYARTLCCQRNTQVPH